MRIITGCSRSGTSFICQLLDGLGADFGSGEELMAADEWNPRGYFENKAVNTLNHRLMFGAMSDPRLWVDVLWPRDPRIRVRKLSTLAISPALTRDRQIEERAAARAHEIADLSEANRGRCVKDPRFCYLMKPWLRYGEVDSVLFVVRHPWESASSMARMAGLPLALTYPGWLDSIRRFWDDLPDIEVQVVDYNAFFDPDRSADAVLPLFEFLGRRFDRGEATRVLGQTLDPELRSRAASEVSLPRGIDARYRELLGRL